jgi:hypothetical protein
MAPAESSLNTWKGNRMKKILMLTTVALLGTTSLVSAQETSTTAVSAFSIQAEQVQQSDGVINLGLVTSEADGVIEIYDIDDTELTEMLGSGAVTAGANTDVKITMMRAADSDVMAVLRVDGVVVATTEVDLDDDNDSDDSNDDAGGDAGGDDAGGDDNGGDDAGGDDMGGDDESGSDATGGTEGTGG